MTEFTMEYHHHHHNTNMLVHHNNKNCFFFYKNNLYAAHTYDSIGSISTIKKKKIKICQNQLNMRINQTSSTDIHLQYEQHKNTHEKDDIYCNRRSSI